MDKTNFLYGITLTNEEIDDCYIELMKKEHNLKPDEIKKLKMGYLFRLSDNIQYTMFDADVILFDEENENYYHTEDFNPINEVKNEDIKALVDENDDVVEIINA